MHLLIEWLQLMNWLLSYIYFKAKIHKDPLWSGSTKRPPVEVVKEKDALASFVEALCHVQFRVDFCNL